MSEKQVRIERFVEHIGPNTVVVQDVDRSILKSNAFATQYVLPSLAEMYGVSNDALKIAVEAVANGTGRDVDYIEELVDWRDVNLSDAEQAKVATKVAERILDANSINKETRDEFIAAVFDEHLLDYVKVVRRTGARMILMTAGSNLTQQIKLGVINGIIAGSIGLNVRLEWCVTPARDRADGKKAERKADIIARCYINGRFDAKTLRYDPAIISASDDFVKKLSSSSIDTIAIVDDKAKHLTTSDGSDKASKLMYGLQVHAHEMPVDDKNACIGDIVAALRAG